MTKGTQVQSDLDGKKAEGEESSVEWLVATVLMRCHTCGPHRKEVGL